MGPLIFLLKDLQAGKAVAKDKVVTALQTDVSHAGNAFATLLVERRRSILWQLNQQLTPLVDEEFDNNGKPFGDDFGKCAKERTDAIRSLSRSSLVLLGNPPPPPLRTDSKTKGVAEKAKPVASPPIRSYQKKLINHKPDIGSTWAS